MIESKKITSLLVLEVLREYSDENHFLFQHQISKILSDKYGIQIERRTVKNCIDMLLELDYDIVFKRGSGYSLFSRLFDKSETRFLIDAIFSSKSIPGNQAEKLANKISSTLSKYERKDYAYLLKSKDINRTTNKQVFYNIEIISEAIKKKKWIGFKYLTFDDEGNEVPRFNGYVFHASPCYLINNFGYYYVLAYRYKYNSVSSWRLDYMKDVYVMEERDMIEPQTLEDFKAYKNITEYMNQHIYLFGGDVIDALLELKAPSYISYVRDWFGSSAIVYKKNGKLFASIKCNEQALYYWVMQYETYLKVLSPSSLVNKILKTSEDIKNKYS